MAQKKLASNVPQLSKDIPTFVQSVRERKLIPLMKKLKNQRRTEGGAACC
jgi:hypothetical protein